MVLGSAGFSNPQVRSARQLRNKKHRAQARCFLIEGPDLVAAALEAKAPLETIFVTDDSRESIAQAAARRTVPVVSVGARAMAALSAVRAPQGVVAAARFLHGGPERLATLLADDGPALILILHELGDPGNVGTLVRCAEAFRARAVCFGPHCVEPYNEKVVRASAGAFFRLPLIMYEDWRELYDTLRERSVEVIGVQRDGADVRTADLPARSALAIGHERHGLGSIPAADISQLVGIAQAPTLDSLNAGVAGAIALYEMSRRLNLL